MSTPTYTLSEIMTNILNAIQDVIGNVAAAISENAAVIGTVIVLGGLAYALVRFGSRAFRSFAGWFRGLF